MAGTVRDRDVLRLPGAMFTNRALPAAVAATADQGGKAYAGMVMLTWMDKAAPGDGCSGQKRAGGPLFFSAADMAS